jgi:hypothetical protein
MTEREIAEAAIELAEECIPYVGEYFIWKWGLEDELNRLKDALREATEREAK